MLPKGINSGNPPFPGNRAREALSDRPNPGSSPEIPGLIHRYYLSSSFFFPRNVFLGSKSARLVRVALCAWLLVSVYIFAKVMGNLYSIQR